MWPRLVYKYTTTILHMKPLAVVVNHDMGPVLLGLLHYIVAASNCASKGYRAGMRGPALTKLATHHTGVYQARFASYIVRSVIGNHRAWRTNRLLNIHCRAPRYRNAMAQTDLFKLVFSPKHKLWDGLPAIHVAVYGRGRKNRKWMICTRTPICGPGVVQAWPPAKDRLHHV